MQLSIQLRQQSLLRKMQREEAALGDRDVGVDLSQISTITTYPERPERTPLC